MIAESIERSKWRIFWWVLGVTGLGSVLGTILGVIFLLIVLISFIGGALHSDGFSTYQPATGTSSNSVNGGSTNNWTGQSNQPVVDWAKKMAPHLLNCGAENYTQCYDGSFPSEVLNFWQSTCSGSCSQYWAQGNLQCVLFVTGAYGAAGQPLPFAQNAVLFWQGYANRSGWTEYENGSALPLPGDIIVWQNGPNLAYPGSGAGHVAIVIDVKAPTDNNTGFVQFAAANSPNQTDTQPIDIHNVMHTWPNFKVLGYIRHTAYFP